MKKKILLFAIFMFLTVLLFGFTPNKVVKAYNLGDVDLLIANPGEDASTQMNFSFHTTVSGVVVEIAKKSDGNFDKAIKVVPTYTSFKDAYPFIGNTQWGIDYGAGYDKEKVSVCEAFANGLEPDTEYMYRVGATNFSETRYFKTAGKDGVFAFAVMADPQVYGQGAADTSNATMNRAMAKAKSLNMNLELVLSAGDESNTGGIMNEWRMLYDLDIYKQMPLASCIGNHDALDGAGGYLGAGSYVFDNVNASPKNGPKENTEGVYYFVWNNVLFIILDSEVGVDNYKTQIKWFEKIVETVPHQYITVMYHRACWGSSAEAAKYWYPTFEKYNIDLSFSGDNHDYGRGSTKVGAERGQKNFPNHYIVCDDARNASNVDKVNLGGYLLVQVTPQNLSYYAFDQNDIIIDQYVFAAKRPMTASTDFNKKSFMETVNIEVLEEDSTKAKLSWGGDFVGNVGHIRVLDNAENEVADAFANNISITSLVFGGLKANESYSYKVRVEFKDGTTETKDIAFATKINYGSYTNIEKKELSAATRLLFNPSDIKSTLLEKVNVYIDGALKAEYEPGAKYVALEKELLTDAKIIELKGVVKSDKSEVLLGTYNLVKVDPVLTVDTKDFEIEEGEESKIKASVDQEVKIIYSSSDNSILTVDENGVVKAIKAGTAQVIVSIEGTEIKKEIKVTVKAKQAETKELETPVIKIENGKLIITKVEGATKYEIYINGSLKETIEGLEVELSKYNLSEGEYKLTVKALGNGETILDSKMSSEATYKVEKSEEPTPKPTPEPSKKGCNGGSYQAIWYVVSLLGLAVVLKKKRLF